MPRISSFPILFDQCSYINITFLRSNGYLDLNTSISGTIRWSINGIVTSSVSIVSFMYGENPYIKLSYVYNRSQQVEYKIYLRCKASNLGKGKVWFFICPVTHKLCRKLYNEGRYFVHREALSNAYYEKQILFKKNRDLLKTFERVFIDKSYDEYYKKYRKKHYRGKPTKREIVLQKKIKTAESYPPDTYEKLLCS